jgi:hypothetical protein
MDLGASRVAGAAPCQWRVRGQRRSLSPCSILPPQLEDRLRAAAKDAPLPRYCFLYKMVLAGNASLNSDVRVGGSRTY